MRHFEIEIEFAGYPFKYKCTTVFEALEVIRAVYDAKFAEPMSYNRLDELAAILLNMEATGDHHYVSEGITVTDVEGEV